MGVIKFKTKSGVRLRTFAETVSPLLVEGTIEFTKEEMRVRGSSQISFCDGRFFGHEDDVLEYIYDWDAEVYSIGISFETLHSCLSAVSPNDTVTILITDSNQNCSRPHVTVCIENSELGYTYEDDIYLLLLETQELDDSDKIKNFDKMISMSSTLLLRVLRNAAKRSDDTQIYTRRIAGKEKIYFKSNGDDASMTFSLAFETNPDEKKSVECLKKDVYSLKYLLLITKATNLSNTVRIYLRDQQYLAVNYKIGARSSVLFCLAPQIDRAADCPLGKLECAELTKTSPKSQKNKSASFKRPVRRRKRRIETATPISAQEAAFKMTKEKN